MLNNKSINGIENTININSKKNELKEKFLSNPAFIRYAHGFETYQNLLLQEKNENRINEIKKRMTELCFAKLVNTDEEPDQAENKNIYCDILNSSLHDCENNKFLIDDFAGKLAASPLAELFLSDWNRQAESIETTENTTDFVYANEIIAYKNETANNISIHIRPAGVKSENLLARITNGFRIVAQKLSSGEIKADRITMKSWLLGKEMEKTARRFLGKDIEFEVLSSDDNDISDSQQSALVFNTEALECFLKDGKKPEVRQVVMAKDDFISRFNK